MNVTSDPELIKRTLHGDWSAFQRLVSKYQATTIALAMRRIGNIADAQEIAQEVFVTVSLKLSQLKKPDRFASWLRSITIRKCQMWLRSQIHTPDLQPLPEHLPETSRSSGDSHDTIGAESLLRQLSPGLQAAAVLCFEDELSPSAAAAQLGIKPSTLRKRLHDARVWLQRRIVENAEKEMRLHVLPRDFAEKCVCRCRRALSEKARKEVIQMANKKNCGCGCLGAVKKSKSTKEKKSKKTK